MKNRLFIVVVLAALLLAGFSFPRTAQAGAAFCHVVRPGENLTQIARQYGVTVDAIVKANNLWNPNVIYVGQCLVIPGWTPSTGCTVTHVVKQGEYLKQIAARYGVTWQSIAQANGLANPNLIYPGQRLNVPVPCPKPTPKPTPVPTGDWKGQYWDNRYLSGDPKYTGYSTAIDFSWGTAGPGHGIGGQDFSARFTRNNYAFDNGRYRFHLLADDGVRFWLDGVLLIDEWRETAPTEYTVDKDVSGGNHSVQIDFFQATGTARLKFWSERVDGAGPWNCGYFNNTSLQGSPVTTQFPTALAFDWGNKSPVSGITADYYSDRCTGEFAFSGGKYRFTATVDDGVRVYLDGNLIIDQWHLNPIVTYTVDVDVSAGNHQLKVEHYENNGVAVLKVGWAQQ